jgi:glycine/D-amino acid oxidase-like deaminating enzyme
MRTQPFFVDAVPARRRPDYPRYRGDSSTGVVIIGGGLTGAACALAFATAGVRVTLLEAERMGAGATGASAGLLRHDFDASFQAAASQHGLRAARHLWDSARRASLDAATALRRLRIKCGLAPQDLVELTRDGQEAARRLRRECDARRAAGVEASWLNARAVQQAVGVPAAGGLRLHGATLDPYRACIGLAAAAAARGAAIHERTPVRRIRAGRKQVEIRTASGSIAADTVLVASGHVVDDLRALRRHLPARECFGVVTAPLPAAVRREVGPRTSALTDTATPRHLLRWLEGDRVLFMGREGAPLPARARAGAIGPNAMELMYELTTLYPAISGVRPEWGWSVTSIGSPDGLPIIGRHRNFPRHLFALGLGHHGAGVAWLAARVLLRAYQEEPAKHDEVFGFARVL